jgi:two-component system, chemotaxis family, response regulator Rcp1
LRRINILVVEDNPDDVFLVREALNSESLPHAIRVMRNGEEALDFISRIDDEAACPDLIVLDINLPKANGISILSRLRQHCKGATIPVIVYSSSLDERKQVEELHGWFFQKPNDLDAWMRLGKIVRDLTQTAAAERIGNRWTRSAT